MNKVQQKDQLDIKWKKMERYWDLIFKYSELRDTLWFEYPERMSESIKKFVRYCLASGFVKCRHEI